MAANRLWFPVGMQAYQLPIQLVSSKKPTHHNTGQHAALLWAWCQASPWDNEHQSAWKSSWFLMLNTYDPHSFTWLHKLISQQAGINLHQLATVIFSHCKSWAALPNLVSFLTFLPEMPFSYSGFQQTTKPVLHQFSSVFICILLIT